MNNAELGYPAKGTTTTTVQHDPGFEGRKGLGGFVDSFKPAPSGGISPSVKSLADSADVQQADQLSQGLKSRHLQMIAIGGSIGTGLFVGSGSALSTGGPASVVIGFALVGIMIYCTVQSLGELAVQFPIAGSFAAHASRFVDPA